MKKSLLTSVLFLSTVLATPFFGSCGAAGGGSLQTIGKIANVASTAQQISGILGPILGLESNQKSSITDIFSNYIGGTNNISSLAETDKDTYKSKLKSLNKNTLGKIDNELNVKQYAKLLSLVKPGSKNPKSNLIDEIKDKSDKSLSDDTISVLSGLLLNGI